MHTFYFPTKTAWISSGSNLTTGVTQRDQNFGKDEILELKKVYHNSSLHHASRILVEFDYSPISKSMYVDNTIPDAGTAHALSSSVYLRMYEAEGNSELSKEYTIGAFAISSSGSGSAAGDAGNVSMSWDEGHGKVIDSPKVTDGVSWRYRKNITGGTSHEWTHEGVGGQDGPPLYPEGFDAINGYQSFDNESPDINLDLGVHFSLTQTTTFYHNNGLMLALSGSQESDNETRANLKFFSRNTNTIYSPKLEVKWNDASFDNNVTGSMNELTMSGVADNYLYMRGLKESYKETD